MESPLPQRLIKRVRALREAAGLTQERFAERAGLSYKYYQAVEAGRKCDLRLSTIIRLASGCGVEVWELFLPEKAVSKPRKHAPTAKVLNAKSKR